MSTDGIEYSEEDKQNFEKWSKSRQNQHARSARVQLLEDADAIELAYRKQSAEQFLTFARGLVIASQKGPKMFESCMALFQRDCLEAIAPALEAVRDGRMPEMRRFWIERTKKAAKDSDLSIMVLWLACFPRRPFYAQIGAADGEQAGIVKKRIEHLLHWNPWLMDYVELIENKIRSKAKGYGGKALAEIDIMRSDTAGAHGGTPDVLIINELSHIQKWEFAENLMDNADGVAQGLVIIATNAGIKGSKAWIWRCTALESDDWSVHVLAKPAPWHSTKTIAEAKKRNTGSRFQRLWKGLWVSGKGDALSEEVLQRAFSMKGPHLRPLPEWTYIAGLDIGVTHDHSALMILGINEKLQRIETALWQAWVPNPKTGEVDLIAVKDTTYAMCRMFNAQCLFYDPAEAQLMSQWFRRKGLVTRPMTFTPANLNKMASGLLQALEDDQLHCYDDDEGRLAADFGKFNIVEKTYGYRLEAVSDATGHADVGTALVVCLPAAIAILAGQPFHADDRLVLDEEPITDEEEIKAMPSELRDIYESEEIEARRFRESRIFGSDDDDDDYGYDDDDDDLF